MVQNVNQSLALLSKYRAALMGFSILWVMLYHFHGKEPGHEIYGGFLSLGMGGVDFFLFLSGLGLCSNYSEKIKDKKSLFSFWKKRFIRIIPTYWLVIIVSGIFEQISLGEIIWQMSCVGFWIGKPFYDWYVPSLLILYFMFPAFVALLHRWNIYKSAFTFCVLGIALTLCLVLIGKGTLILFFSRIPVFFVGCIFGYRLQKKEEYSTKAVRAMYILAIVLFAFELWLSYHFDSTFLRKTALHHLPFALITPGALIMMSSLFQRLDSYRFTKYVVTLLSFLGVISLEIYLCHMSLRIEPYFIFFFVAIGAAYILNQIMNKINVIWKR